MTMISKRARTGIAATLILAFMVPVQAATGRDQDVTARIIAEALKPETGNRAWERVAEFTDKYPARMSGSANLEKAIAWSADRLRSDGLKNVRVDKVMVPHWERGAESAAILSPYPQPIRVTALGGSVGTAEAGVEAEVLVVRNFDELEARAAEAKGRIVVYNFAFDEAIEPLKAYVQMGAYRANGASRAAKLGAVAALIRAVGPVGQRTPHTGAMRYADDAPKIPVASIVAEDTEKLQRMQGRGDRTMVRLVLGARQLPDAESGNVIAELPGRERPDEVVLLGCHIDSWDLSPGAMDDAGGCVAIWEAALLLKRLDLTPRRTIRLVLFTNEENGVRGGQAYRDRYADQLGKHVLAIETDDGALPIRGYGFRGTATAATAVEAFVPQLSGLGGTAFRTTAVGGSDIQALVRAGNVPVIVLDVDMRRYFQVHHTDADTVDKILPGDLARLIGALAATAYNFADAPQALDRAPPAVPPAQK